MAEGVRVAGGLILPPLVSKNSKSCTTVLSEAKDLPGRGRRLSVLRARAIRRYCFEPPKAPSRQDLQIPKPVPLAWMKLQSEVKPANSEVFKPRAGRSMNRCQPTQEPRGQCRTRSR